MTEKSTSKLNGILKQTHLPDFERFCLDNRDSMLTDSSSRGKTHQAEGCDPSDLLRGGTDA